METSWTEDIIVTVSGWLEAAGPYLLVLLVVVVVYRSRQLIAGIIEGMRGEQTSLAQEARVAAKEEREAVDEPPVPKPPASRPQKTCCLPFIQAAGRRRRFRSDLRQADTEIQSRQCVQ